MILTVQSIFFVVIFAFQYVLRTFCVIALYLSEHTYYWQPCMTILPSHLNRMIYGSTLSVPGRTMMDPDSLSP